MRERLPITDFPGENGRIEIIIRKTEEYDVETENVGDL